MSEKLRIVVGSDDAGFDYKEVLKKDLQGDVRVGDVERDLTVVRNRPAGEDVVCGRGDFVGGDGDAVVVALAPRIKYGADECLAGGVGRGAGAVPVVLAERHEGMPRTSGRSPGGGTGAPSLGVCQTCLQGAGRFGNRFGSKRNVAFRRRLTPC